MKHWVYTMIILPMFVYGQNNLVPNGNFETYSSCPDEGGQIDFALHWQNPVLPSNGTPDYYNVCTGDPGIDIPSNGAGHQSPHSGNAYAGVFCYHLLEPEGKEYIQIRLTDTIIKGIPYRVSFWASLADNMNYSISTLGAYFSETAIDETQLFTYSLIPQIKNDPVYPLDDKVNWVLITDTFSSNIGNELYLTIGNFYNDSLSDPVFLNSGEPNWVSAYYYIDDVSVIPLDSLTGIDDNNTTEFELFPNPTNDNFTIQSNRNQKFFSVEIVDIHGRKVLLVDNSEKSNQLSVSVESLEPGMYLVKITFDKGNFLWQRVIVSP